MDRRNFVRNTLAGASTIVVSGATMASSFETLKKKKQINNIFKMNYAPHQGMFKYSSSKNILDQLNYIADYGFKAFEDNNMKSRAIKEQEDIAKLMTDRNIKMGVFVAHNISWKKPNLTNGDKTLRDTFLKQIKESVEVAKRVNAKWMTVVPGHVDLSKEIETQTANVIDTLKYASDILEPHSLIMVLEPLNFRDHPGLFLTKSAQAYQICKAVNSSSCKILFDIYHQQIQEGNLMPNIDAYWNEIAYFQIGDNPGRNEPTTGEINYKNVFKFIHDKGFKGILGMEHGNSKPNAEGEQAVIEAYKEVDNF